MPRASTTSPFTRIASVKEQQLGPGFVGVREEWSVQPPCDVCGGGRLATDDPHHVVPVPGTGLADESLGPAVVVSRIEHVTFLLNVNSRYPVKAGNLTDVALEYL